MGLVEGGSRRSSREVLLGVGQIPNVSTSLNNKNGTLEERIVGQG
jgi:hypothetical protein